jgi:hypothetical protein
MYRMKSNPSSLAVKSARGRKHRRGDATFVAIAALVAILFVTQLGWVATQRPHSQASVSRT